MPEDLMRYDQLAQNALKGVVREALRKVERSGLPGEHHFYIQFDTRYPGVSIGDRLLERYPREMTVVLQHQFYNLIVTDERFQVELSFDNIPEKLVIPFASVKGFLDPAVQFGLQFELAPMEAGAAEEAKPAIAATKPKVVADTEKPEPATEPDNDAPKVVSLDAFRKK
ncbi:MAG: ClpXP protease specificity-enhancing factor SspB [Aestuariivirga sp.]